MLENIGIDGRLLTFQIVNFLVLVIILNKFLYKPVLKMIKDRQHEISSGLKLKAKMEEREESLVKERKRILKKAREEAQALLERKKKDAVEVKERIIADARSEKGEIVAQGKREIETNRREMEKQLQSDVVEVAYGMTQKVLQGVLSEKNQESIIRSQLDKLVVEGAKK